MERQCSADRTTPDSGRSASLAICTSDDVKRLLGGWRVASVHVVEGGHYFCVDNPERTAEVLEAIALPTAEIW